MQAGFTHKSHGQRAGIIFVGLSGCHKNIRQFVFSFRRQKERQSHPLSGNLLRRGIIIPDQAPVSVQIGLRKLVSCPVGIHAYTSYCRYAGQPSVGRVISQNMFDNRIPRIFRIEIQSFLPHRDQITDIDLMPCVLLGNLKLQHLVRLFKGAEQRRMRLPNLEINGTVFNLKNHIVRKFPIQLQENVIRRLGSVQAPVPPILFAVIYKAAPDNDTAVGSDSFRQHIGSFIMISSISKRPRPSFRICLHHKTGKIRYHLINLCYGFLPPLPYLPGERIRRLKAVNAHRRRIVNTQKCPDSILPEHIGNLLNLRQIFRFNKMGFHLMYIYIINGNGIDSHRAEKPGILTD